MSEELNVVTTGGEQSTQQTDTGDVGHVDQTTAQDTTQEKTFKQAELDTIIKDRLAKERQRFEAELKGNPHLSYLSEKAKKMGVTIDQLIENDRKYDEQAALNQLVQQNIPEEYAKKLLEHDKVLSEYQKDRQSREKAEKEQKAYAEFLEAYPDVKPDTIPPEVWKEVQSGRNLLDAYIRHENQILKTEMAKFQTQQQTQQANDNNAGSSTGSARTSGKTGGFISQEEFDTNKHSISWVRKNLSIIEESRKRW